MSKISTLIFERDDANSYAVRLYQNPDRTFTVVYGKEIHAGLDYSEAAKELGLCIMHALTCESKIQD